MSWAAVQAERVWRVRRLRLAIPVVLPAGARLGLLAMGARSSAEGLSAIPASACGSGR